MFLRCSLIHKSIIIPRYFLYLLYLCPCLDVGLLCLIYVIYFSFSSSFLHTTSLAYSLQCVLLLLDNKAFWFQSRKDFCSADYCKGVFSQFGPPPKKNLKKGWKYGAKTGLLKRGGVGGWQGRENKDFKKGGKLGQGVGALKMRGGGGGLGHPYKQ